MASAMTARMQSLNKEFSSYVEALEVTTESMKRPLIITNVISTLALPTCVKMPLTSSVPNVSPVGSVTARVHTAEVHNSVGPRVHTAEVHSVTAQVHTAEVHDSVTAPVHTVEVHTAEVPVPLVPVPLRNVRNNCYFNAAVQSIAYMPEIHELLSLHDVCGVIDCVACRFKGHLSGSIFSDDEGSLYKRMIKHFKSTISNFVEGNRMDSAECFHEILSLLAAKCPELEQRLKDLFEIQTPLPDGQIMKNYVADVACNVDSIKNFVKHKYLRLPKIITIHANRVTGYDKIAEPIANHAGKITNADRIYEPVVNHAGINVLKQFNVTDIAGNTADYDLNSFIVYTDLFGVPHYLSYVKAMDGKWYRCDDTNIEQIQDVDEQAKQASVFFYRKRS
jgi:ubiquitin C-terminal hydrolase